jgi:hypothetical protein
MVAAVAEAEATGPQGSDAQQRGGGGQGDQRASVAEWMQAQRSQYPRLMFDVGWSAHGWHLIEPLSEVTCTSCCTAT